MKPLPYLRPAMIARRKLCLAWIMAHRPQRLIQPGRLWLARLQDTPAYVAQQWRNGSLVGYAAQLIAIAGIALPIGAMFGLYF